MATANPPIAPHERKGLEFLERHGSDCVGVIDTDEKFCAAIVWATLSGKGLVQSEQSEDGPVYSLTTAGRTALDPSAREGDAS